MILYRAVPLLIAAAPVIVVIILKVMS